MVQLLVRGGHVCDPSQGIDGLADILIRDGRIAQIGHISSGEGAVLDASGLIVTPGLIDMHVHLREPGNEGEETIASGSAAAAAGGFTSVACMPNTDPVVDNEAAVSFQILQGERAGKVHVFPIGAVTKGQMGEELAEMGQMARGGAVAFSDDGKAVKTAGVLCAAMRYAAMLHRPIIEHCEDLSLSGEGVMHEGDQSILLGMPGIPAEAEEIVVSRDIAIARLTGCHLHIAHLSTAGSVELVRRAKQAGVSVSAEVTPHHLFLSEEHVRGYDTSAKMNPPLRTDRDMKALLEGLQTGVIDAIASDHAPHAAEEKAVEFQAAPFGAIGLESTLAVLLTRLVHGGIMSLTQLLPLLTSGPSRILGLGRGTLAPGSWGDLTCIDLDAPWVIDAASFASKSRNCPFQGWQVKGRAALVVVAGRPLGPGIQGRLAGYAPL